jgi:hypothetical protein
MPASTIQALAVGGLAAVMLAACASPSEQPFSSAQDGVAQAETQTRETISLEFRAAVVEACIPVIETGRTLAEIDAGSEVIAPRQAGEAGTYTTANGAEHIEIAMNGAECRVSAHGAPVEPTIRITGESLIDPFAYVREAGGQATGPALRETYAKTANGKTYRVALTGAEGAAVMATVSARQG